MKFKKFCFWPLAAVAIVVVGFTLRGDVGPALHAIEAAVLRAGPLGPLLFIAVAAVWATLCLPGPILLTAAGTLFASRPVLAIACASIGDTIAQAVAFQIACRGARDKVKEWVGNKPWYLWLEDQISTRGAAAVFTIRLMPFFPNSIANYAFGLLNVPFGSYLAASWAGTLPTMIAYVGGTAGVVHILKRGHWEHDLWIALGIVVAVSLVTLVLRKKLGSSLDDGELVEPVTQQSQQA